MEDLKVKIEKLSKNNTDLEMRNSFLESDNERLQKELDTLTA